MRSVLILPVIHERDLELQTNRVEPTYYTHLIKGLSPMFSWLKKDPAAKLKKDYLAKLENAMLAQRNGDIRKYSALTAEAEAIRVAMEALSPSTL